MTDPRALYTAELSKHHLRAAPPFICTCGDPAPNMDAHVADVLLALKGVTVVEVPEPLGPNRWPVNEDDDDFCVSRIELVRTSEALQTAPARHPGVKISWGSIELNLCTLDAETLAASLLSAIRAAEVER